ncbi:hypothetical protein F4779DRAFT_596823 [Xylariaceae sp. FL0662B]|nr:hypothetical protein F4779DRAFT_596823 [Xylariaceae sp. FL0662B]
MESDTQSPSTQPRTRSIKEKTEKCMTKLNEVRELVDSGGHKAGKHALASAIRQDGDRFKTWSKEYGALEKAEASLNHRLRNEGYVYRIITRYLDDLYEKFEQSLTVLGSSEDLPGYDDNAIRKAICRDVCELESFEVTGLKPEETPTRPMLDGNGAEKHT